MEEFNILFTSAGRRVALIRAFRQALEEAGVRGEIVTSDLKADAPAHCVGDAVELVPRVSDAGYVERLKEICGRRRIRLVVPLIDTELHLLAPFREEFAALGTTLLISSLEVTGLSLDKRLTHDFFRGAGIATPRLLDPRELLADSEAKYPVMLKPARGSCSVGVTRIANARDLEFFLGYVAEPIVQELIAGEEYTLDILAGRDGRACSVVPRLRIETRAGEISKGVTVKDARLIAAGEAVVNALPGAFGPITAQCFVTREGRIVFIEINPRFGGGFPLSAEAGANFPLWIIEMVLGRERRMALDEWRDGVMMRRFDEAFFTDTKCAAS